MNQRIWKVTGGGLMALALIWGGGCSTDQETPAANLNGSTEQESQDPTPAPPSGPAAAAPTIEPVREIPFTATEADIERAKQAIQGGEQPPATVRFQIKTNAGNVTIELDRAKAPITVDQFIKNVDRGQYNDTAIHHIEAGRMVLTGLLDSSGKAKTPGPSFFCEADNGLKNVRGAIAMARDPSLVHSANGQFFFNVADNPHFDHRGIDTAADYGYCVFGKVVSGMEVVDRIAQLPLQEGGQSGPPRQAVVVESIQALR